MEGQGSRVIRPIQYLRGIAALSVVWLHTLSMDGFTELLGESKFGNAGVDIFFVISGFIMLTTTFAKPMSASEFIRHRIVRVVPLYWVATLLMVLLALLGFFKRLQFSAVTLIKSLLFIPYGHEPVLVPGWTLNYEMFFYAAFSLSLLLPRRGRFPALATALLALVAIGYVLPEPGPIVSTYTSPLLLEFLAGSVIAYLFINQKLWMALPAAIASICLGTAVLFGLGRSQLMGYSGLLGAALVVAGSLNASIMRLKISLLLIIGDASYSIYLTHPFCLAALRVVWLHFSPSISLFNVSAFMLTALVVSAAFGVLAHFLVEKPMTRILRNATRRVTPAPIAHRTA